MSKTKSDLRDDLAVTLADNLNKKFKNTGYQNCVLS
jgi:hypothetical protein